MDDSSRTAAPAGHVAGLHELVTIYRRLSGLATRGADLQAVTDLAATTLDAGVWLVNERLDVMVASLPGRESAEAVELVRKESLLAGCERVLQVAATTGLAVRSPIAGKAATVIVAPVSLDGEVAAYLATTERAVPGGDELALLVAEHAATICGVVLGRERALATAAGRARDDLIGGLLLGKAQDTEELRRWARYLGYDETSSHRVLIFADEFRRAPNGAREWTNPERRDRMNSVVEHFCRSRSALAVTAIRDGEVVVLAPERVDHETPTPVELGAECLHYCRELFSDVRPAVGVSGTCESAADIPRAYGEARRTIDAAGRLGRRGVVTFSDLGALRLLLQIPDQGELRSFVDEVLGELLAYDRKHAARLVATLAAFFEEGGSSTRMARRLHVHPNTIAYRLRRIGDLSPLRLDDQHDRLNAQLALEILPILEGDHG